MVDLVKIRKKKAEKKAQEAAAASSAAVETPATPDEVKTGGAAGASPAGMLAETPAAPSTPLRAGSAAAAPQAGTATQAEAPAPQAAAPVAPSKLERFKQEAGRRREAETVQQEESAETPLELLTFLIAGEQYAVDIERIVEIVTPRAITRVPNADASVLGIISLRGTIVTLVDVRRKLRHPAAGEPTADSRIVVIDLGNETVGFDVDRVLRVVKTRSAEIEPHPVVHATETDDSVRGVFRAAGALTILLDLDKLLAHESLAARTA